MRGDALSQQALKLAPVERYGLPFAEDTPSVTPSTHKRSRRVALDKMFATQPFVIPSKLKNFDRPGKGGRPTVREQDGRVLVKDGHHRIVAAKMRGQKSLLVDEYL